MSARIEASSVVATVLASLFICAAMDSATVPEMVAMKQTVVSNERANHL